MEVPGNQWVQVSESPIVKESLNCPDWVLSAVDSLPAERVTPKTSN